MQNHPLKGYFKLSNLRMKFMRARQLKTKSGSSGQKQTFAMILENTRTCSARKVWERARIASVLRHQANKRYWFRSARVFSTIKIASVHRAIELAPELIRVVVGDDLQTNLISVQCNDGSKLHLPASSKTGSCKSECDGEVIPDAVCASAA